MPERSEGILCIISVIFPKNSGFEGEVALANRRVKNKINEYLEFISPRRTGWV